MVQFSYSFCMALLHSLWQAALLALLYLVVDRIVHKHNAPLAKRNFLYTAILTQLVLFGITFSIYFFDSVSLATLNNVLQPITGYINSNNLQWLTPWIFGLYIIVLTGKMIKAIYNWLSFKSQYRSALHRPPVDLKLFTEMKAFQFGIKRKVKLWLSSSVNTPVTFGFFKPVILLPVALVNHISTRQAETLILHELTHIRTNDYLFNWFLIVAESIFFFNPFVLNLCNKIRLEREKNCDIQVMSFNYSPALYAETLLQAERMKQLVPSFQLAAVNKKKHLLKRIQFFTNEKILTQPLHFNLVAPLMGLVLLLMLSTALLFQSTNKGLSQQIIADAQFLPFSSNDIELTEFESPVIANNKPVEQNITGKEAAQTIVDNKIIPTAKPQPEAETETVSPLELEMNYALPVSISENDADREIIIKEEGSGSSSVTTYHLSYINGKWVLQPGWVITAQELKLDSLSIKIDSLNKELKKIYRTQQ